MYEGKAHIIVSGGGVSHIEELPAALNGYATEEIIRIMILIGYTLLDCHAGATTALAVAASGYTVAIMYAGDPKHYRTVTQ